MYKKQVKNFIQARIETPDFEGCYYSYLGDDLFLVFAKNDNDDLDCKVAYNSDDLQCDYDWDWTMPENEYGDLISQDWTDVIAAGYTADQLVEEVEACYKFILGCGWTKPEED